jgi:hypothetical protein
MAMARDLVAPQGGVPATAPDRTGNMRTAQARMPTIRMRAAADIFLYPGNVMFHILVLAEGMDEMRLKTKNYNGCGLMESQGEWGLDAMSASEIDDEIKKVRKQRLR